MGWTEGVAVLRHAVADGIVPGAVLLAGTGSADPGTVWAGGELGQHSSDGPSTAMPAVTAQTVFDLASLTKVLATVPAVLRLADTGDAAEATDAPDPRSARRSRRSRVIALDDAAAKYLPDFVGPGKDRVTIRHLLSHTAGLPAHRKLRQLPGALVFDPLGLPDLRFRPPAEWRDRTAATEIPPGGSAPKLGVVHDENADALDGVAGHAGLFGTAPDAARCLRTLWLTEESPLSAGIRAEAFRCQSGGLGGRRGLGWTLRGDRWDHLSTAWPQTGAGHTGFTGTSVALDPVSGMWVVLLTNAVRLGRDKDGIVTLRRYLHDALASGSALAATANADAAAAAETTKNPETLAEQSTIAS
jgi:CubicO group peptidase (beta-lactamase class C family)